MIPQADGSVRKSINGRLVPIREEPDAEAWDRFLGKDRGFDISKLHPARLTPEQERFVRLGPGYYDGFTMESFFNRPPGTEGRLILQSQKKLSPQEREVAEYLASLGNVVECYNYKGPLKMGDFLVNGVRIELKTLMDIKYAIRDELPRKISRRITNKGEPQAYHIFIDARKYDDAVDDVLQKALDFAQIYDYEEQIRQLLFFAKDGPKIGRLHRRYE